MKVESGAWGGGLPLWLPRHRGGLGSGLGSGLWAGGRVHTWWDGGKRAAAGGSSLSFWGLLGPGPPQPPAPASGAVWSAAQVGERVHATRAGLAALGVGKGDMVAIISRNRLEGADCRRRCQNPPPPPPPVCFVFFRHFFKIHLKK